MTMLTPNCDESDDGVFQEENITVEKEIGLHFESDSKNPMLTEKVSHQNELCILTSFEVKVCNCTWGHNFSGLRSKDDEDFGLFICNPPYGTASNAYDAGETYDHYLQDKDFMKYSEKCFNALKRGGYIFCTTSADYSEKLKIGMGTAGFIKWNN